MGIVDSLKKIYFSIEDKYYGLADSIENTGIKIYEWFINPIEERGLPSFPFFLILVALLLGGAYFGITMFLGGQQTATVRVTVLANGVPVDGAQVKLFLRGQDTPLVATTVNGVATFQAPNGATATVMIRDSRFKEFSQQVVIGKDSSVVANLESAVVQSKKLSVIVTNAAGQRISDAFIEFSDDTTGASGQVFTNGAGTGLIDFQSEDQVFYLTITHAGFESGRFTCYASQPQCTAILSALAATVQPHLFGDVRVSVKDDAGKMLEARVTLYSDLNLELSERHTTNGEVFFTEIAEVGTRVCVTVEPDSDQYSSYYGCTNDDTQAVTQASAVVFNIPLLKKTGDVDLAKLSVQVVDESKKPISGAKVALYSMDNPKNILTSKNTDASGNAVFDFAFGHMVYAAVWASGYLPSVSKSLSGGYATQIVLTKLVQGNYGDVSVNVKDADGNPVELAKVWFTDADGFNIGMPAAESGVDGSASFTGLPLQKTIKAVGALGSLDGSSDLFTLEAGVEKNVSLQLTRAYAFINASAKDRTKTTNAFLSATFTAYYNGAEIASCITPATPANSSCQLKIYANRDIVLKVTAVGFVDFESEAISIPEGATQSHVVIMLPENLKDELVVTDFHLDSRDDVSQTNVQQVERGSTYNLVMSVNIPDSDAGGFFVRVGDKQDTDSDVALMDSFDQPSGVKISWGSSFDSSGSCADLQLKQDPGKVKWVQFKYPKGTTGVKTFGAVVKISSTAKNSDKLNIYERAFFVRNNFWVYNPEDEELGSAENTGVKENCFAQTETKSFTITEGKGKCTDKACLAVSFVSGDSSVANGLEVPINSQFNVVAEVRSFSTVSNPYIKITTPQDSGISIPQTRKQLDFSNSNKDSFTTLGSALLPTEYAAVRIEYGDESGAIISLERFVAVKGTDRLIVFAKPNSIDALKQSTVTVSVTTSAGTAIKDANVFIEESAVFAGNPNGDYAIAGDGTQDRGAEGKYKFSRLNPLAPGFFNFKITRRDFADAFAPVNVVANEFLQADVTDVNLGGTMTECNDGFVTISNGLEADITVKASVSFPACVALDNNGAEISFTLKAASKSGSEKRVRLTPVQNANCLVSFNSVLNASGSASTVEVQARVDCPKLTPVEPPPSACSSNNCPACNEDECLDLFDRTDSAGNQVHYCIPDYQIVPGGTAFTQCKPGNEALPSPPITPSVSPSPSPGAGATATPFQCGPNTCSACDENKCKSLQAAGYCMPFYNKQLPSEINITDIGTTAFSPSFLPVQQNSIITFRNVGINSHTIVFDYNVYPAITLGPQETRSINLAELNPPASLYYFRDSETSSAVGAVQVQTTSSTGFSYCGKFEQLNETQVGQCSETNCAACTEAQCLNIPASCEPTYTGTNYTEKLVSVTDAGFNPQVITVKTGGVLKWKNDGVQQHQIVFNNHPELDTGVFTAGQTKQLTLGQEGDYSYKCALHTNAVGRVIVSSSSSANGRNFVTCVPKGAAGPNQTFSPGGGAGGGTGGNQTGTGNQTNPACDPANFDFNNMLARRLGQYHANQLFNPNSAGRSAAASASNRLVLTNYGWQVEKVGANCQVNGMVLSCEKSINALFPKNGMSFSVQNRLGVDTSIDVGFLNGSRTCFKITNAEQRTGFDQFVTELRDFTTGALGLPQNQYRTYVLMYDATQPGCAEWRADLTGLHVAPTQSIARIRIASMSLLGGSQSQFYIEFRANNLGEEQFAPLALVVSPMTSVAYRIATGTDEQTQTEQPPAGEEPPVEEPEFGDVGSGGSGSSGGDSGSGETVTAAFASVVEEPFVFSNNVPAPITINAPFPSFTLAKASSTSTTGVYQLKTVKIPTGLGLSVAGASIFYPLLPPVKQETVAELAKFDVVGNAGRPAEDGMLRCSGTTYCSDTEAAQVVIDMQTTLSQAYAGIYEQMDSVRFTGFVDGSLDVYKKALDDASRDYEAALQTYAACKALGSDPIAELEARCARQSNTPGSSDEWGAVYGDAFAQAGCDSELFAYARSGQYGNQMFWQNYKQRILTGLQPEYGGQAPGSGNVGYARPLVLADLITVNVPVKIAGADGGTFIATFKPSLAMQGGLSDDYWSAGNWFGGMETTHLTTISGDTFPDLLAHLKTGYSNENGEIKLNRVAPFYYVENKVAKAVATSTTGFYNTPTLFTLNKYLMQVAHPTGNGAKVLEILNEISTIPTISDGASDSGKKISVYACVIANPTESACNFPTGSFVKPTGDVTYVTFQLKGNNLIIASNIVAPPDGPPALDVNRIIEEMLKTGLDETHEFNIAELQDCGALSEDITLKSITLLCGRAGATEPNPDAIPPSGGQGEQNLTYNPSNPAVVPSSKDLTTEMKATAPFKICVPSPNYVPAEINANNHQTYWLTYRITTAVCPTPVPTTATGWAEHSTYPDARFTKVTLRLSQGTGDAVDSIQGSACRTGSGDYAACDYPIPGTQPQLFQGAADWQLGYNSNNPGAGSSSSDPEWVPKNDWLKQFGITISKEGSQLKFAKTGGASILVDAGTPLYVTVYGKWENEVTATSSPNGQLIPAGSYVWGSGTYAITGLPATPPQVVTPPRAPQGGRGGDGGGQDSGQDGGQQGSGTTGSCTSQQGGSCGNCCAQYRSSQSVCIGAPCSLGRLENGNMFETPCDCYWSINNPIIT